MVTPETIVRVVDDRASTHAVVTWLIVIAGLLASLIADVGVTYHTGSPDAFHDSWTCVGSFLFGVAAFRALFDTSRA